MTIGIGAYGPHAGEAVFRALRTVEKVAEGSIRGFAVYAVMLENGATRIFSTQRGGTATLIVSGEKTGVMPPEDILNAPYAAVISSGPDRPEPLTNWLPACDNVGLVTGHRIPTTHCRLHDRPLNREALELIQKGATAYEAIETVLRENSSADVGLIAIDMRGRVAAKNTVRVDSRPDAAKVVKEEGGAVVAVLMNEIHPTPVLAELAASVAIYSMTRKRKPDIELTLKAGIQVEQGARDEVHVNQSLSVIKIVTPCHEETVGERLCGIPYGGAPIIRDGEIIGFTLTEPWTLVKNGLIQEVDGKLEQKIAMKLVGRSLENQG
jgi:hypothetical protein